MTKHSIQLSFFVSVVIFFGSCAKEGKPEHRKKIASIVASETLRMDDQVLHHLADYKSEKWNWDDNEVYRIDYSDDATYSEVFFYDSRHRIVRTEVQAYGLKNLFYYRGKHLVRLESYSHNELMTTYQFIHDGSKLSDLWVIPTDAYFADSSARYLIQNHSPLLLVIGSSLSDIIQRTESHPYSKHKGNSPFVTSYHFEWHDGNMIAMSCTEPDGKSWTATMTYDSHRNPNRNLYGIYEMNDPYFGFQMMSKNNLKTLLIPYDNRNQKFDYSYEYKGEYPTLRRTTYSYVAPNETTWEDANYTYEKEERITYL